MKPLHPLIFEPQFLAKVWGGRNLETLYKKSLPDSEPIGESWEITDRPPDAVSVILNGHYQGQTLRDLMETQPSALLGSAKSLDGRFPLLLKILDAQDKLSLQVHPPASVARELNGEPKTELWYIAHADDGAQLYVGLRKNTTREEFKRRLAEGTVADCFHSIRVKAGDVMFLPSGRVHGIGGGIVIFEVQQNSDTTYRVFDWNRPEPDGKLRKLHIPESLQSIDFEDFEPGLVRAEPVVEDGLQTTWLAKNPFFHVRLLETESALTRDFPLNDCCHILAVVSGEVVVHDPHSSVKLSAGRFCLLPASLGSSQTEFSSGSKVLAIRPGTI